MAEYTKHPDERTILERLEWLADNAMSDEVNIGLRDIIREIQECLNADLRNCGHCGSPFTFERSDGDIACYDCPGIMPVCNDCDRGVTTYEPDANGNCPYCGTPKEVAD